MTQTTLWVGFNIFILLMLALDLGVFNRKAHVVTFKESAWWTVVWIILAGLFNLFVFYYFGEQSGFEFLTGYVIEKSLSVDNIFVFIMVFSFFKVKQEYQHRILFWGILGALLMRGMLIAVGSVLIAEFHWVMYIFGAFLIFTGIKMLTRIDKEEDLTNNPILKFANRIFRVQKDYEGDRFFLRPKDPVSDKKLFLVTPLFIVLVFIEFTDLIFAVDSIPAIFAVTKDPFIVYTSNVFAILGLRSIYFMLAGLITRFYYIKYALSFILVFVGIKMIIVDVFKIPILLSLFVILGMLVISVIYSVYKNKKTTV